MKDWEKPLSQLVINKKVRAIHALFGSNESLLQFLFHHKNPGLREEPATLLEESRCLSHGESLLIQVAIDLWCDQGGTRLSELLTVLDDGNLLKLIRAMAINRELVEIEEAIECCD